MSKLKTALASTMIMYTAGCSITSSNILAFIKDVACGNKKRIIFDIAGAVLGICATYIGADATFNVVYEDQKITYMRGYNDGMGVVLSSVKSIYKTPKYNDEVKEEEGEGA